MTNIFLYLLHANHLNHTQNTFASDSETNSPVPFHFLFALLVVALPAPLSLQIFAGGEVGEEQLLFFSISLLSIL